MQRGLAFDRVAELYDRARPGYPERLIDEALRDRPIRDVLEVGCGPGRLTAALVARGLHVEVIEPGANLAAIARGRTPEVEVHVARFEELELADASFDAVFSAMAFHWVDPGIGWAKAARVLRPLRNPGSAQLRLRHRRRDSALPGRAPRSLRSALAASRRA